MTINEQADPSSYTSVIFGALVVVIAYLLWQVRIGPQSAPSPPPPVRQPAQQRKHLRLFPFPHFDEEYLHAPIR